MKSASDQGCSDQEYGGDIQWITAFLPEGGETREWQGSGGNPCKLLIVANTPDRVAPSIADITECYSWPATHNGKSVPAVSCFTAQGQAIQCCGHGLLAAAHSWQQRLQCSELNLLMNGSLVQSWREQEYTWLGFERLRSRGCPVPDWLSDVFPAGPQPVAAAMCGDEHGYLILQWPDDFNLKLLARPGSCFAERTQRALICTSAQPSVGLEAIALRYFAPQYGVEEDTATGSAIRVLADYWSPRFTRLTAQQCSPAGGLLLARLTSGHVEVGGRCKIWDQS